MVMTATKVFNTQLGGLRIEGYELTPDGSTGTANLGFENIISVALTPTVDQTADADPFAVKNSNDGTVDTATGNIYIGDCTSGETLDLIVIGN